MKNGKNIKTIIKETKQQLIEKDEYTETLKNRWYDEECNRRKEESKRKVVNKGRRENEVQEYHLKRKEAHKIMRNKKKLYIKNVTELLEEDQNNNNTRKMYQKINQFKKGYQHKFNMIKNKKENWQ